MERLYKFTYSLLVMAFLSISFNSCIKEDLDNCSDIEYNPTDVLVYFDYLPATYANIKEGINPEEVTQMNLYWFDAETDFFLGEEIDDAVQLSPDYFMTIAALPAGKYRFIAWGNLSGNYSFKPESPIVGTTTFDRFATYLNTVEDDSVKNKIAPLFFAQSGVTEIKGGDIYTEIKMPIVQNTYTINLTVKGRFNENSSYKYVITDDNTFYGFDNSFIPGGTVHYMTDCGSPKNGDINGSITTLRIGRGRSPILKLIDAQDKNDPVFSIDLVQLILDLEKQHKIEIDFSRMYEFNIEIKVEGDSFIITINGWKLTYTEEELHG